MNTRAKNIEDEIQSLASSIKLKMVDPAGRRIEKLEERITEAEKSIHFLKRALYTATAALTAAAGWAAWQLVK